MAKNSNEQNLGQEYPCSWLYKVIGSDETEIRSAISNVLKDRPCSINTSHKSKTGKYQSVNLEVDVVDENDRNGIYESLKSQPGVKYLL